MSCRILEHLADVDQPKENDYAAPQLSVPDCANKAETRLMQQYMDQIPDNDGLTVHHARGAKVPAMHKQ